MPKHAFAQLNSQLEDGLEPFANPQCRGRIIALLDPRLSAQRPLDVFLYSLSYAAPGNPYQGHWAAMQGLRSAGLKINPRSQPCATLDEVIAYCQQLSPIVTTSNTTLTA